MKKEDQEEKKPENYFKEYFFGYFRRSLFEFLKLDSQVLINFSSVCREFREKVKGHVGQLKDHPLDSTHIFRDESDCCISLAVCHVIVRTKFFGE